MNLQSQINEDIKQAMRDKSELKLMVLRMLSSAIKNKMISMRNGGEAVLSDEEVQEVISGEVKKRQDSAETYLAGAREDLAEKERAEIEILKKYLPEQLSPAEVENIVKEIISQAENKDFGRIMGQAMARMKGRADGKLVGETIKRILS